MIEYEIATSHYPDPTPEELREWVTLHAHVDVASMPHDLLMRLYPEIAVGGPYYDVRNRFGALMVDLLNLESNDQLDTPLRNRVVSFVKYGEHLDWDNVPVWCREENARFARLLQYLRDIEGELQAWELDDFMEPQATRCMLLLTTPDKQDPQLWRSMMDDMTSLEEAVREACVREGWE